MGNAYLHVHGGGWRDMLGGSGDLANEAAAPKRADG